MRWETVSSVGPARRASTAASPKPGTLISAHPIPAPPGARAWRILYRSTTTSGKQVVVSGMVVAPSGKAPRGGRDVLAWAHGTTGVAKQCAPSTVSNPARNLVNYFSAVGEEVKELTAALGAMRTQDLVGRCDLLVQSRAHDRVDLTEHDGPRVLVATDCLSEGINLQHDFDAVVHYDLSWNPTRHEQREGRVDPVRLEPRGSIERAYFAIHGVVRVAVIEVRSDVVPGDVGPSQELVGRGRRLRGAGT